MRRALAGQFLVVSLVIPIVVICGPDHWERSHYHDDSHREHLDSGVERANTVRTIIQMESINEDEEVEVEDMEHVPPPWDKLHRDERMRGRLVDLLKLADDMNILEWGEYVGRAPPSSVRLKEATKYQIAQEITTM